MPDPGVRVALLARAGDVREQLRTALTEAGAEVVAEGDPAELDPGTVAGRQPGVVVVSLEPAIEDALAEFDDLLAMPGIEVIYDDAEVTGKLDGWDLARWARHLAAKLAGSAAVLPPAPADSEPVTVAAEPALDIQPGAPPTPAQEMDHHRLEDYAAESLDLSEWVPTNPSLTEVVVDTAPPDAAEPEPSLELELDLDLDLAGLEEAMATPEPAAPPASPSPVPAAPDFELVDEPSLALEDGPTPSLQDEPMPAREDEPALPLEDEPTLALDDEPTLALEDEPTLALDDEPTLALEDEPTLAIEELPADEEPDLGAFLDLSVTESFEQPPEDAGRTGAAAPSEALLVDFEISDEPVNFSSFSRDDDAAVVGLDDDIAALAAQLEANQAQGRQDDVREPDFARVAGDDAPAAFDAPLAFDDDDAAPTAHTPPAAAPAPSSGFGNLELTPMDGDAPAATPRPSPPVEAAVGVGFGSLSLVDDDAPGVPAAAPAAVSAPTPAVAPASLGGLSLVDDDASATPVAPPPAVAARRGALFVIAGLGGPDGVRQLLAALPAELPVPVLLYQHLDTGKHDRLVSQLAKASRLPLDLAVAGGRATAGRVAVLPPGLGVEPDGDLFSFVPTTSLGDVVAALPATDSAVLVLSGGDPSIIASALAFRGSGGRLFAQEPASCFDAGAPQALVSSGATSAPVPVLAQRITECWS